MSENKETKTLIKLTGADVEAAVKQCEAIRKDPQNAQDITLSEFVKEKWQLSMEQFYEALEIDPNRATIENIMILPDSSYRWLVPEIIRDSVRLGLRKAPIYPNLIAAEQSVSQLEITLPAWNMSDAMPKFVGIAETITVGNVSFGQKKVRIRKMGRGIKMPYEVRQYVAISLAAIWFQDFGVKMGMGLDMMALNTLINGDQTDGSDSAPVIGVATANSLVYRDMLRPWVRGSRLGRNYTKMVTGEEMGMDLLELFRYKPAIPDSMGVLPNHNINLKTSVPDSSDLWIHGAIPANQALILDSSSALIKLNAQPLLVESEKIVSNQTEATYCSFTTGFATVMRDARIVLDKSLAFSSNGFPAYMDPTYQETMQITE